MSIKKIETLKIKEKQFNGKNDLFELQEELSERLAEELESLEFWKDDLEESKGDKDNYLFEEEIIETKEYIQMSRESIQEINQKIEIVQKRSAKLDDKALRENPYYIAVEEDDIDTLMIRSTTKELSSHDLGKTHFPIEYAISPTEEYISKFKRGEEVPIIPLETWTRARLTAKAKGYFFLHGNNVYKTNRPYNNDQLKLLILDFEDKERKKFERLKHKFSLAQEETKRRRERIPEEVRVAVWRRDEGKCVECESRENLEYDHIIPVSKGGSSTTRNIQLLCEQCNREKSDKII